MQTRNAVIAALLMSMLNAPAVASVSRDNRIADVEDQGSNTCAIQRHLYGTVTATNGHTIVIKSTGSAGIVYLLTAHATIRPEAVVLRPGLVVRARGCFVDLIAGHHAYRTTYLTVANDWEHLRFIPDRSVRSSRPSTRPSETAYPNSSSTTTPAKAGGGQTDLKSCSGYRWPTKIGADADASAVNLSPQDISPAALQSMRPSGASSQTARLSPSETSVYRLRNVVVASIYAEHDRDYHLIVKDASGHTITLESPDPACAGGSAFIRQITAVRSYLDAHRPAPGTVLSVTGIGFFDSPGSGGFELHPLLAICGGTDCSPSAFMNGWRKRTIAASP